MQYVIRQSSITREREAAKGESFSVQQYHVTSEEPSWPGLFMGSIMGDISSCTSCVLLGGNQRNSSIHYGESSIPPQLYPAYTD